MKKIKWTFTLSLLLGLGIVITMLILMVTTDFDEGFAYLFFELIFGLPIILVASFIARKKKDRNENIEQ